jgi:hypothetical protein
LKPVGYDGAFLEREEAGAPIAACATQRAGFDEAEAHGEKFARHARVLVEAGGHADRIGKIEAEELLAEPLVVGSIGPRVKAKFEALDGEVVRAFGIEREQERLPQTEQPVHAATPSGRRWTPSVPRLRGSAQRSAERSSGA